MRCHLFKQKLLSLENAEYAVLNFEKYVSHMSPSISQTPIQLYYKIFHHLTNHLKFITELLFYQQMFLSLYLYIIFE
jgi:hypothetical protein